MKELEYLHADQHNHSKLNNDPIKRNLRMSQGRESGDDLLAVMDEEQKQIII